MSHSSARNKSDLVARLAVALSEPSDIDTALASLSREELLALDACDLASAMGDPRSAPVAYRILGGARTELPRATLDQCGLLLTERDLANDRRPATVPRAVAARLRPLDDALRPPLAGPDSRATQSAMAFLADLSPRRYRIEEMILLLASRFREGGTPLRIARWPFTNR